MTTLTPDDEKGLSEIAARHRFYVAARYAWAPVALEQANEDRAWLLSLIERLKANQSRQRFVITLCGERFREYEKLHLAKPDHEKARRNAEMAEMCEEAIRTQGDAAK